MKAARLLSRYAVPGVGAAIAIIATLVSPAHAADIGKGQRIYSMHCAVCHGPTGLAVMPGAPNFARNERNPNRATCWLDVLIVVYVRMPPRLASRRIP